MLPFVGLCKEKSGLYTNLLYNYLHGEGIFSLQSKETDMKISKANLDLPNFAMFILSHIEGVYAIDGCGTLEHNTVENFFRSQSVSSLKLKVAQELTEYEEETGEKFSINLSYSELTDQTNFVEVYQATADMFFEATRV